MTSHERKEKGFKAFYLTYDFASECEITPYIKIDKPLVVYRFSGNVMKCHTYCKTLTFSRQNYDFKIYYAQ